MTWCLVFVEARREPLVRRFLKTETYFPQIRERGRKSALFPNYIFARLIYGQWSGIRWTPHVLAVILDRQAELENVVTNLRKRERDGYVRLPRAPRLHKGDPVRITAGSFEGHVAWYEGQSGSDRVRVLLDLLGRKVPLDIAESQISTPHLLRHGHSSDIS